MIHIGSFEISTAEFMICTCIVLFAVQLALCTYVKRLWVRLLPVELFSSAAVVLGIITFTADGWDALGFLLLAIFALACAVSCGLAWAVWGIFKLIKKRTDKGSII